MLHRWLNRDPLGEPGFELVRRKQPSRRNYESDIFINTYLYVKNNPVTLMDPFGLDLIHIILGPIGLDPYDKDQSCVDQCLRNYDKCASFKNYLRHFGDPQSVGESALFCLDGVTRTSQLKKVLGRGLGINALWAFNKQTLGDCLPSLVGCLSGCPSVR